MDVVFCDRIKELMESFLDTDKYEIDDGAAQLMTDFLNKAIDEICKEVRNFETETITSETIDKIFENPEIISKICEKFLAEN